MCPASMNYSCLGEDIIVFNQRSSSWKLPLFKCLPEHTYLIEAVTRVLLYLTVQELLQGLARIIVLEG